MTDDSSWGRSFSKVKMNNPGLPSHYYLNVSSQIIYLIIFIALYLLVGQKSALSSVYVYSQDKNDNFFPIFTDMRIFPRRTAVFAILECRCLQERPDSGGTGYQYSLFFPPLRALIKPFASTPAPYPHTHTLSCNHSAFSFLSFYTVWPLPCFTHQRSFCSTLP